MRKRGKVKEGETDTPLGAERETQCHTCSKRHRQTHTDNSLSNRHRYRVRQTGTD